MPMKINNTVIQNKNIELSTGGEKEIEKKDVGNQKKDASSSHSGQITPWPARNPNIKNATPDDIKRKSLNQTNFQQITYPTDLNKKADPNIISAKNYGQKADDTQFSLRQKLQEKEATGLFKNAVDIVMNRNMELERLGAFTATSNMNSPHNGAHFWSGSSMQDGKVVHSAMLTAQEMAKKTGGVTLEMTEGGHALHNYSGEEDSFSFIKERFKYTDGTASSNDSYSVKKDIIEKGVNSTGIDMMAETGLNKTDAKEYISSSKHSTPHILWDIMSMRYADKVTGEATSIHAVSENDPYVQSDAFQKNTWNAKERPALEKNNIPIKELFSEQLQGELVEPYEVKKTNWSNTGGFIGNIKDDGNNK
ncbi:hypothetical protein [Pectobacterium colocasium]|uniref:hypothetical protein n=2 Tax=Pectobacterium colocasium TaxID=2878098 RepID=UPI001CD23F9C|nr:hypothetical protein [Pectobacterium colocasium]